jgi:hypothetical protein
MFFGCLLPRFMLPFPDILSTALIDPFLRLNLTSAIVEADVEFASSLPLFATSSFEIIRLRTHVGLQPL